MPGITIIGDSRNAARNRPTSLPAEARSLSRHLRLLQSPEVASEVLMETLASLPQYRANNSGALSREGAALQKAQEQVSAAIQEMKESGWEKLTDRYAEYHMALAVESVLRDPVSFVVKASTQATIQKSDSLMSPEESSDEDDVSNIVPTNRKTVVTNDNSSTTGSDSTFGSPESHSGNISGRMTKNSKTQQQRAAVVSDASSTEESDAEASASGAADNQEALLASVENELDHGRMVQNIWAIILESLQLQVASRTTRVWGKKKIYEVYQFARPAQDFLLSNLPSVRHHLEQECVKVFEGVPNVSDFRIFATMKQLAGCNEDNVKALYIALNIGKIMDLQDERNRSVSGEKKKKDGSQFVAVLLPGSKIFALTASRSPSRSRYTPQILAILENVLTETTNNLDFLKETCNINVQDLAVTRLDDLSGTEPYELFRAARSMTEGEATGRFAFMAASDRSNPIIDLQKAVTEKLHTRDEDTNPLSTWSVICENGTSLCVDHSAAEGKSRKRGREEALGRTGDCPKLQRICWKWSGETSAASACWLDDDDEDAAEQRLTKTKFKCAVVMKGEDVMGGLQTLIDAGLMDSTLPDFIRDAPSMGCTIRVDNGSFVNADTPKGERKE